jgi:hypothetical protein
VITGDGLKTLDAVRPGFELTEIDSSLDSFEATIHEDERLVTAAR